jgi:hypothetical protein
VIFTEEEVRKNLGTLENPQEALVKKRFVMNKAFGNYRQKMEQEKKKVPLGMCVHSVFINCC